MLSLRSHACICKTSGKYLCSLFVQEVSIFSMAEQFEWTPPTEAEMKAIEARRERSDKISKLMGEYMLKGYTMLGTSCGKCNTVLLRTKQGLEYCVSCSELDSDTDKDNPALNSQAALVQAREQHVRSSSESNNSTLNINNGIDEQDYSMNTMDCGTTTTGQSAGFLNPESPQTAQKVHKTVQVPWEVQDTVTQVMQKMDWARKELGCSVSVEGSIQLCNLIKTCAETVKALEDIHTKP
ncbi:unnamed protein product [Owenia fusiformis]|uniref:Uncharacterized protein n=1 Tax=Owenia fusiformis TaxID=6347 RepID=A0A8J1U3J3_OWEFU|nr:unnamed protein product [Owenia fusiformis]